MSEPPRLSLSIEQNAHAFLCEAVDKALQARTDIKHWQFAILHLVQSLELSLKSLLKGVHEAFVYENVDRPQNTVTLAKAMERLENPMIKGIDLSNREKRKINQIIRLRNQITHADFELIEPLAEKQFFDLFAFIVHFQARHLNTEVESIIPREKLIEVLDIEKSRTALLLQARARMTDEGIDEGLVLPCPACSEETFVIQDGIDTCYLCRSNEETSQCPQCDNFWFNSDMESFIDELDISYEEGQGIIHNDYGYTYYIACPECYSSILEDIGQKRADDEAYWASSYEALMQQFQDDERAR